MYEREARTRAALPASSPLPHTPACLYIDLQQQHMHSHAHICTCRTLGIVEWEYPYINKDCFIPDITRYKIIKPNERTKVELRVSTTKLYMLYENVLNYPGTYIWKGNDWMKSCIFKHTYFCIAEMVFCQN